MSVFGVVLFHSDSSAFQAERALKDAGLDCKLVPTPRELSSDCGVALRFNWASLERVREAMESDGVDCSQIAEMP